MSMYADYLRERTDDRIIETEKGFATYRYINDGSSVYIVDIFVAPAFRRDGAASELANRIAAEAKGQGATEMLGSVRPSAHGSTASLDVLRAYGMSLHSAVQDGIIMRKDL